MVYSRFAILTIDQELTETGYIIKVTTNHACHLWMRWTNITPVKHHSLSPERGASFDISTRYCFVGYHDNEQEEEGDTYTHTFIKEPWPHCETRWFYFIGQVSAGRSASDTAVFIKHRVAPEFGIILLEPWTVRKAPPPLGRILLEPWTTKKEPPPWDYIILEEWTS